MQESDSIIQGRINKMLPILNEQQRRFYLAIEAESIGRGGITRISRLSGVSRSLVSRGLSEQASGGIMAPAGRLRRPGGGRKKEEDKQAGLRETIEEIVSPHTMGDPCNPLVWSSKSLRHIQSAMAGEGYHVSHEAVRQLLMSMGYSLQLNRKTKEGGGHPDRDAQFEFINEKVKAFTSGRQPVISVDCKKKEPVGDFANPGREWAPEKSPREVNVYDFIDKEKGKAAPYGVYDVANNRGWVNVGISSDTASFAVSTIRDWWEGEGQSLYPGSGSLYINADGGGSNGSRNRLWKQELQLFSNQTGLDVHVSHFPPGTSKWNKIEHRLFCFITKNWRGKPLDSLAVIVNLINSTTTEKGLSVRAKIDETIYEKGIKITDEQMEKLNMTKCDFHGEWNYIIKPVLT